MGGWIYCLFEEFKGWAFGNGRGCFPSFTSNLQNSREEKVVTGLGGDVLEWLEVCRLGTHPFFILHLRPVAWISCLFLSFVCGGFGSHLCLKAE